MPDIEPVVIDPTLEAGVAKAESLLRDLGRSVPLEQIRDVMEQAALALTEALALEATEPPVFHFNEMHEMAGDDTLAKTLVYVTDHLTDLVVWAVRELKR